MWAGCGWSGPDRRWELYIVTPGLERSAAVAWPDVVAPPTLLDRFDALARLGYAVVEGGPEAWEWTERLDEQGRMLLVATTEVRPLRLDELPVTEEHQPG